MDHEKNKEALVIVKQMVADGQISQDVVEKYFPELAESEDERCKKEITELVMEPTWKTEQEFQRRKELVSWLEKQGEQKPELKFDIPEIKIKDDVSVTSRLEHISEELKPIADFVIDFSHWNLHKDEWNHPVLEVPLFRVLDALVQKGKPYQGTCCCVEQKPVEWSEEDEKMLEELLNYCDTSIQYNGINSPQAIKWKKRKEWFKFLKDKIQPQPKQKWSEDEKKKLDRIYSILGIAADEHAFSSTCRLIGDKEAVELQDFLRSIAKLEQKPGRWSDEDDWNTQVFINALELYNNPVDKVLLKSWIKSFKYRCKSQSKQEWSEEDKEITRSLLDIIYECHSYGKCALKLNEYSKLCNWLRFLKERCCPQKLSNVERNGEKWKPSKEQLEALISQLPIIKGSGDKVQILLESLYDDLKKIQED